jgi:hypothetical protein
MHDQTTPLFSPRGKKFTLSLSRGGTLLNTNNKYPPLHHQTRSLSLSLRTRSFARSFFFAARVFRLNNKYVVSLIKEEERKSFLPQKHLTKKQEQNERKKEETEVREPRETARDLLKT